MEIDSKEEKKGHDLWSTLAMRATFPQKLSSRNEKNSDSIKNMSKLSLGMIILLKSSWTRFVRDSVILFKSGNKGCFTILFNIIISQYLNTFQKLCTIMLEKS